METVSDMLNVENYFEVNVDGAAICLVAFCTPKVNHLKYIYKIMIKLFTIYFLVGELASVVYAGNFIFQQTLGRLYFGYNSGNGGIIIHIKIVNNIFEI